MPWQHTEVIHVPIIGQCALVGYSGTNSSSQPKKSRRTFLRKLSIQKYETYFNVCKRNCKICCSFCIICKQSLWLWTSLQWVCITLNIIDTPYCNCDINVTSLFESYSYGNIKVTNFNTKCIHLVKIILNVTVTSVLPYRLHQTYCNTFSYITFTMNTYYNFGGSWVNVGITLKVHEAFTFTCQWKEHTFNI